MVTTPLTPIESVVTKVMKMSSLFELLVYIATEIITATAGVFTMNCFNTKLTVARVLVKMYCVSQYC